MVPGIKEPLHATENRTFSVVGSRTSSLLTLLICYAQAMFNELYNAETNVFGKIVGISSLVFSYMETTFKIMFLLLRLHCRTYLFAGPH